MKRSRAEEASAAASIGIKRRRRAAAAEGRRARGEAEEDPLPPRTLPSVGNRHPQEASESETMAAIQFFRSSFQRLALVSKRPELRQVALVPQHFVYSVLPDRTAVDREMESLRVAGRVRKFRSGLAKAEYMIALTQDYLSKVDSVLVGDADSRPSDATTSRSADRDADSNLFNLAEKFKKLLGEITEIMISNVYLRERSGIDDAEITMLISQGFLTIRDADSYWFAVPHSGFYYSNLARGREELTKMLKRRKFGEMPLSMYAKRKLNSSVLPIGYHLSDLIGCEIAERISTPTGEFLRLLKK